MKLYNYYYAFMVITSLVTFIPKESASMPEKTYDYGEVITDLSFKRDSDYILILDLGKLELYSAQVTVDDKDVFMYVIKYPSSPELFFDYVFFNKEREPVEVLGYFKSRWEFLIKGIENGYIHFEENPLPLSKGLYGTFGAPNSSEGAKFGNIHFSQLRLDRLKGLVAELEKYLNQSCE